MNLVEIENQMERFRTNRLAQQEKIDAAWAEVRRLSDERVKILYSLLDVELPEARQLRARLRKLDKLQGKAEKRVEALRKELRQIHRQQREKMPAYEEALKAVRQERVKQSAASFEEFDFSALFVAD
jgi:DNA anti-recombination protein RmuC